MESVLSPDGREPTLQVFDAGLRRSKAIIKLKALGDQDDPAVAAAFRDYCTGLASVRHANVATPYTYGTFSVPGELFGYMTRSFVSGTPLSEVIAPLDEDALLKVIRQICAGLAALHRRDIFHLDLKPENVIVRRAPAGRIDDLSECVLIDLSYRPDSRGEETLSDVTVQYVAPELLDGSRGDASADLYALGVVLYRLATGRLPFAGESLSQIMQQQRARQFEPIETAVSVPLKRAIEQLLEPNPLHRPKSPDALIAQLDAASRGQFTSAGLSVDSFGVVGRPKELDECLAAIDVHRLGGATAVEVSAAPGGGVTTFLRDLQDRLESEDIAVLTVRPRAVTGTSLAAQLATQVVALLRRNEVETESDRENATGRTSTDVLDDLFVATQDGRIVLFVDGWSECDVTEFSFLRRLMMQDRASVEGLASRSGRCQLVLGTTRPIPDVGDARKCQDLVELRVRLSPLTIDAVSAMLAGRPDLGSFTRGDTARIAESTDGRPGSIVQVLARVGVDLSRGVDRGRALEGALAGVETDEGAGLRTHPGMVALRDEPTAAAHLALALWNAPMRREVWHAVGCTLGLDDLSGAGDLVEATPTTVRTQYVTLGRALWAGLAGDERDRIVTVVLEATRSMWKSGDLGELAHLCTFVARSGAVPVRYRWRLLRALIVLLRNGCFAEVESIADELVRAGSATVPWWIPLFRDAARASNGGIFKPDPEDRGAPATATDARELLATWIRARALRRGGYRREAYRLLKPLASSTHPIATIARAKLLEDYGLAAAGLGDIDEAVRVRRLLRRRACEWIRLARRQRDGTTDARDRGRACRRSMEYLRVKYRVHMARGHRVRARAVCRQERAFARSVGNLMREAACLNHEGIALLRMREAAASIDVFERCASLQERLDDERGLVLALLNLSGALSLLGRIGSAAGVLNRARVIATRNELPRYRNRTLLNLGNAYGKRGQWSDARNVFRRVLRLCREEGDVDLWARAAHNSALAALASWNVNVAHGYALKHKNLIAANPGCAPDIDADLLAAEIAYRGRDWTTLSACVEWMRRHGANAPTYLFFDTVLAVMRDGKLPRKQASDERSLPTDVRLRLLLLRWRARDRHISGESLGRLLVLARNDSLNREYLQCLVACLASRDSGGDLGLRHTLAALSRFELREGEDDLQIELRAHVAYLLRRRGRVEEAWRVYQDALTWFRRLERKIFRWPRARPVLSHLHRLLRFAMRDEDVAHHATVHRLSQTLCADAFVTLMDTKRGSARAGNRDGVLEEIGQAIDHATEGRFVDELLAIAVRNTGAQRAMLVVEREGEIEIERVYCADGDSPAGDAGISRAVVSQVLRTREPGLYSDALTAEELASHRSIAVLKLRSLACVPVEGPGGRALYLDHLGIAGLFCDEHLGFLGLVAGLVALTTRAQRSHDAAEQLRERLARAHSHILRAERSRVIAEVAGGLIHDLKNVLAAVIGRVQLVQQGSDPERAASGLKAIQHAADTGVGLLQRLQQCSRDHASQEPELVDIAAVAREAVDLLRPRFDGGSIELKIDRSGNTLIQGVPGEIRELFLNLISNACEAIGDKGTLEVSVRGGESEIVVRVKDTGHGMSEETRTRVFEPFFTTKGSAGTGLGLVVVRNTVVRHGGSISVESAPGVGTTFVIRLPRLARREYENGATRAGA